MDTGKYFYKPIDAVREEIIGAEIVDIESKGNAIHLKSKSGREYTLDTTSNEKGVVVHAYLTVNEELELIKDVVDELLKMLDIDFDFLMSSKKSEVE